VVKPYHVQELDRDKEPDRQEDDANDANHDDEPVIPSPVDQQPQKRGRGRPRKYPLLTAVADITLQLQTDSQVIPFTASRQKEIIGLLEKGVFEIVQQDVVPRKRNDS
jgi:hypothetical protein